MAIADLIGHDPQQPGSKGRPATERGQCPVRLYERFLNRILGLIRPAHEAGSPEGEGLVGLHQLPIGSNITLARTINQLGLVQ